MANLTIFRQTPKCKRMSSRQGYQQSGEFDDISPNTKMQANELKTRVPKSGEFHEYGIFDDISPKTKMQVLSYHLNDIFTRLKIVSKEKTKEH